MNNTSFMPYLGANAINNLNTNPLEAYQQQINTLQTQYNELINGRLKNNNQNQNISQTELSEIMKRESEKEKLFLDSEEGQQARSELLQAESHYLRAFLMQSSPDYARLAKGYQDKMEAFFVQKMTAEPKVMESKINDIKAQNEALIKEQETKMQTISTENNALKEQMAEMAAAIRELKGEKKESSKK